MREFEKTMRIAILEDETALADQMLSLIKSIGHSCHWFATGQKLIAQLKHDTFDMVILDWNLPDTTGIEVLKWMRDNIDQLPPILFVTSRGEEADIVSALELGADDYIVKPIRPTEAAARINALLRRRFPNRVQPTQSFGPYHFDRPSQSITVGGQPVDLTPKEFKLALVLFENLDRALSREYVLESVWGHNPDLPTRTIDAHVSRVRNKLGLRPETGYRLSSIYSYGYRLEQLNGTTE